MSLAGYSTCRIQFIPHEQQRSTRDYSDRSIVELRQSDFADYLIRALDIDNNKEEIFNIRLTHKNLYKREQSPNSPDEVRDENGRYLLWLNALSRATFHQALDICFEQLSSLNSESSNSSLPERPPSPKINLQDNSKSTSHINRNDVLVDIYQLGEQIRLGNVKEAVELAKNLAEARVQLKANSWDKQQEQSIAIKVKIDGIQYKNNNQNENLIVSVYPSTTIRELRAIFEYSHNFLPINQYIFVNGHLAHDDSTIRDLNIHPDSLFVLFVIEQ